MTLYLALKYLHVLFAVIAVGFNFSYPFWLAQGRKNPSQLAFILKSIGRLDRVFANRAYMGLAITGPLMVWWGGYSWRFFWIWMSLTLLVLTAILGIAFYGPLVHRQIGALEAKGADSPEYLALEKKSMAFGLVLYLIVAVILFLMVTKYSF